MLSSAPLRQVKKEFPTPLIGDVLFSEFVDATRSDIPPYGTPHPDPVRWPNHKLVFARVAPQTDRYDVYEFFYAADREFQDLYNWTIEGGETLIRDYIIPRELYFARTEEEAADIDPPIVGEFTCPEVATPDTRFPKYGFADDTLIDVGEPLKSRYVGIRRRFLEPVVRELVYNEQLERNVLVTRELIPAYTRDEIPEAVVEAGKTIEIRNGNTFHDVRITQEVLLGQDEEYPLELTPLPGYADYNFPAKLESVKIRWAAAIADSNNFPHSYSEDFYFDWKLIEPRPGPYPATITRFITNTPAGVMTAYPMTAIPSPVRETISMVYSWYRASNTEGNSTQAMARSYDVPASIHDTIPINYGGMGDNNPVNMRREYTSQLGATPGYETFNGASSATIGFQSRPIGFGLFEVQVTTINIAGLYSGGSTTTTTVLPPPTP
jgi:hypothetical protein